MTRASNVSNYFFEQSVAESSSDNFATLQLTAKQRRDSIRKAVARARYLKWYRQRKANDSLTVIEAKHPAALVVSVDSLGPVLPDRSVDKRSTDWITMALFVALIVLAIVRNSYSKYLQQVFAAATSRITSMRLFGESNSNFAHASYQVDVFSYMIIALFIWQSLSAWQFKMGFSGMWLYFSILSIVVVYSLIRFAIHSTMGHVFQLKNDALEYIFNIKIYNKVLGIILLPFVLANAYVSVIPLRSVIIVGFLVIGIVYFLTLLRGISIFLRKYVPIYYLILYLCTLEILPLMLIWKTLLLKGK